MMGERLSKARTKEEKETALRNFKVCDPASGSGHFLLAAGRRLGRELARVRTREEEPAPEAYRESVRDIIRECLYAVNEFLAEGYRPIVSCRFIPTAKYLATWLPQLLSIKYPDVRVIAVTGEIGDEEREWILRT